MSKHIDIEEFLALTRCLPPLDVRAPTEFADGHIPNAQNLPLFSDEERAEVGTLYKQAGKESAVDRGLEIVGPKMAGLAREARKLGGENQIPIYCARGGMRSNSVAWLLETSGLSPVVLDGGYKQFRQWVLQRLERSLKLRVIGGLTGSGKTLILNALSKNQEQVLDLEGLANHFGSAFGAIGQPEQPTQAQFENQLAWTIEQFDPARTVWVEDESRMVGRRCVSPTLFEQMRSAPLFVIQRTMEERVDILAQNYSQGDRDELIECTQRIAKRLGGERSAQVIEQIQGGHLHEAIKGVLFHYDRTYTHGMSLRDSQSLQQVDARGKSAEEVATLLAALPSPEV